MYAEPGAQLGRNRNRQLRRRHLQQRRQHRDRELDIYATKRQPERRGHSPTATVKLRSTIVSDPIGGANCAGLGPFTTQGYNLSDNTTGCGLLSGAPNYDLIAEPQLGPLQANGGPDRDGAAGGRRARRSTRASPAASPRTSAASRAQRT